jgi:hypothetical protein
VRNVFERLIKGEKGKTQRRSCGKERNDLYILQPKKENSTNSKIKSWHSAAPFCSFHATDFVGANIRISVCLYQSSTATVGPAAEFIVTLQPVDNSKATLAGE